MTQRIIKRIEVYLDSKLNLVFYTPEEFRIGNFTSFNDAYLDCIDASESLIQYHFTSNKGYGHGV